MKTFRILATVTTILAATVLLTDGASAQWSAISGFASRNGGNYQGGGYHESYGNAIGSTYHAYTSMRTSNRGSLLGSNGAGGEIWGESYANTNGSIRASFALRMRGFDVSTLQAAHSIRVDLLRWGFSVFPTEPTYTVYLLGLPVTLSGNISCWASCWTSFETALTPSSPSPVRATITGSASAGVAGTARVLVGFSFAGAGVEAQLTLGGTSLSASVTATRSSTGGGISHTVSSLRARIVAFVTIIFRVAEVTLVDAVLGQSASSQLMH